MVDISKHFSEEEIKAVVWRLVDKVPGMDGFPIIFFQHFWDIVKPKFIDLLEYLHGRTLQLHRINYTHMVLIPEKGETKEVGDFDRQKASTKIREGSVG